jgi:hypothetical protein
MRIFTPGNGVAFFAMGYVQQAFGAKGGAFNEGDTALTAQRASALILG